MNSFVLHVRFLTKNANATSAVQKLDSSEGTPNRPNQLFVQKFGGTSLGTQEKLEKIVNIVKTYLQESRVACVVSAISSETKLEGTTSRLLNAAQSAISQEAYSPYLDAIEDLHLDIVYSMIRDTQNRDHAKQHILNELRTVRRFCESLTVIREISPRSHDMIVGCGERLSAGVIACILQEHNIPTAYIDLSKLFDEPLDANKVGYHMKAITTLQRYFQNTIDVNYVVPVVTGYMGDIAGGIINGIGRGYSDLTAALLAAALRADALQVKKLSN